MSSYIPEHYYGAVYDADGHWTGQRGLVPWPKHLKPGQPEPLPDIDLPKLFNEAKPTASGDPKSLPTLVDCGGVFFLTLSVHDRVGIATTIERLINMLDALDGDENLEEGADDEPTLGWPNAMGPQQFGSSPERLDDDREIDNADWEPWLGSVQWYPYSQDNLAFGVRLPPSSDLHRTRDCSQESWASGSGDDREEECEDEGAQDDREYSLGWQDEGNQGHLQCAGFGDGDMEADLGTTEEIDQVRRLETAGGVMAGLDEPCLGWAESHGRGIVGTQNCLDDREHEDEREPNGDELDYISSEDDAPTAAPMALTPMPREQAARLPDDTIMRRFQPSDVETMIPQISPENWRAIHYRAGNERLQ